MGYLWTMSPGKGSHEHLATIPAVIDRLAAVQPSAGVLLAPSRAELSCTGLRNLTVRLARVMRGLGIERGDRVAVVMPWGPELATTYLAVSQVAIFAPLNPAYTGSEFEFYLTDLAAELLITSSGSSNAAAEVAGRLGIRTLNLEPVFEEPAGTLAIPPAEGLPTGDFDPAQPGDVALVLHTSGTTARPKLVPLTHRNLCTSARNIARTLKLGEDDRSLAVMPLFHIHALVSSILAPLVSGGSFIVPPGFLAPSYLDWLEEFRPTWYTCSPTIHFSMLERVMREPARIKDHSLRFIRTGAAAMPPNLHRQIEEAYRVPVIEFLGMTEAAQQITSNNLPPGVRKIGSVGQPAGPEVAIMNNGGGLLPQGSAGEIVIRGDNVTPGYLDNPEANQKAFCKGWFRTGDEGYFDQDGFLFVTGRLKEMINRGGEKISPREVDEALYDHPSIAHAVTFAVPHVQLGEEVGAAVVLRDGEKAAEREIRSFVSEKLADFKIPRVIKILDEIPKGPTGKLQRIGLAERLGIGRIDAAGKPPRSSGQAPTTQTEEELAAIWSEVLGIASPDVAGNFFALGGDSVLLARLLARVEQQMNVRLPLAEILDALTIRQMAEKVGELAKAGAGGGEA